MVGGQSAIGTNAYGRSWSSVRIERDAGKRQHECVTAGCRLDFRLFIYFQRVIDLNAEVSDCTLKLGMPEQQLNGAQI